MTFTPDQEKLSRQEMEMSTTLEKDQEGWIPVHNMRASRRKIRMSFTGDTMRRSRNEMRSKTIVTNFDRVMKATTTSYFFSHFPESWGTNSLWRMFEHYGRIGDL